MHPAIFLDRDGVIIENRENYVRDWRDVDVYAQALSALATLATLPHKIVLVTNQSVVGRGLIPLQRAQGINERLVKVIERAGGRVDAVFMCPHAPADGCDCRKPAPGLLLQAAEQLALDLGQSLLVGDALTDLAAGRAAGVAEVALVRTGRGEVQSRLPEASGLAPFPIFDDLEDVVNGFFAE